MAETPVTSHLTVTAEELRALERIQDRILWLATYMVHYANQIRPNVDGMKVGGHQASSASVITLMTALYGLSLRPDDRVAVKPHASPVFHAIQYLRGRLPGEMLRRFRSYGGLQSYPSRTKDVDGVDYSTGSMGLGAVAATFGALSRQYLTDHFGPADPRRFIALVGDAELDEGNIWEAVTEEHVRQLGNVLWIIDLNRQSLDRVVPDGKAQRIRDMFGANGWRVINLKYGRRLQAAFARPGGAALRRRIDDMPNAEYQALLRLSGADVRKRLIARADGTTDAVMEQLLGAYSDGEMRELIRNLGGHDLPAVLEALGEADAERARPVVIVAYTIKGWRLPFEGDPMNHSMLLTPAQIEALREELGIGAGEEFAGVEPGSLEWRLLHRAHPPGETRAPREIPSPPAKVEDTYTTTISTQEAFSRVLSGIARDPIADFIVTASADVAVSTHLGGWINRRGVYARGEITDYFDRENIARPIRWREFPKGQHIELGVAETNLFLLLTALGLAEMEGGRLIPIGTLYDPFICRGLEALFYAVYSGARFIVVATPSGVSLAPEGGLHQSTMTASIGTEMPGLDYFEPAFAREVEWILLDAMDRLRRPGPGLGVYLRLSTVPIDQGLFPLTRPGLRRDVLEGGYRIVDRRGDGEYEPEENVVHLFAMGPVVPEAMAASEMLREKGIMANVFAITAPGRLYRALATARRELHAGESPGESPLERLLDSKERRAPVVTVADAHSHSLAFLGSALGGRAIALGVDTFGESGSRVDLYRAMSIDRVAIARAAEAALVELDSYT